MGFVGSDGGSGVWLIISQCVCVCSLWDKNVQKEDLIRTKGLLGRLKRVGHLFSARLSSVTDFGGRREETRLQNAENDYDCGLAYV